MTFNLEFFQKIYSIVCQIYDYFVIFADTIINKTVLQSYSVLSSKLQVLLGEPDSIYDLINPLQLLKEILDYIVLSGIAYTPIAEMPTIVFLFSTFVTLSLGIALLKIFK